jgi:hypothetical protein
MTRPLDAEKEPFPFHAVLHTYFAVSDIAKVAVRGTDASIAGVKYIDQLKARPPLRSLVPARSHTRDPRRTARLSSRRANALCSRARSTASTLHRLRWAWRTRAAALCCASIRRACRTRWCGTRGSPSRRPWRTWARRRVLLPRAHTHSIECADRHPRAGLPADGVCRVRCDQDVSACAGARPGLARLRAVLRAARLRASAPGPPHDETGCDPERCAVDLVHFGTAGLVLLALAVWMRLVAHLVLLRQLAQLMRRARAARDAGRAQYSDFIRHHGCYNSSL